MGSISAIVEPATGELKRTSVRAGAAALIAQVVKFGLQTGSTMILARLLSPEDFGLQGMVLAMTGFLSLFRDAGLSMATVQREVITHEQTSTLFWINLAVGAGLFAIGSACAPALAVFYKEPRICWVTIVSSSMFLFTGLAAQHQALLRRSMRFVAIAKIDVYSMAASTAVGVAMSLLGAGYWSLAVMPVANFAVNAAGSWLSVGWVPGMPRRRAGVRSMLRFGGTVTLNGLVTYVAYNAEKVLLGRYWGAAPLGIYGRAFQLVNLPVQQLNASIGSVAFPAISRIQNDAGRLYRAFLKGYTLLVSLTLPVTITSVLFAEEIVRVLLGPAWMEAASVLRYLAPTVMAFSVINPFGWFLQATGRVGRSLNIAFLIAPVVIIGISVGLPHGPAGVAVGYSAAMVGLIVPTIAWAIHGTGFSGRAIWTAVERPLLSALAAAAAGFAIKISFAGALPPLAVLGLGLVTVLGSYCWILLIAMGQKELYRDMFNQLLRRTKSQ